MWYYIEFIYLGATNNICMSWEGGGGGGSDWGCGGGCVGNAGSDDGGC